jgi:signal transduction histidine kinase
LNSSYNSLLIANDKLSETNEKFAPVNKELVQVSKQIKQYQEKQTEFINNISHELKTPIPAIVGYIELLYEEPEKKFEYGDFIIRNAERLQKIISDIRGYVKDRQ